MIILLDTSTATCYLTVVTKAGQRSAEWEAGRQLAGGLLEFLQTELEQSGTSWQDLKGIGIYSGPGSFTGLRIGHTVANTLADTLAIPIVGSKGEDWRSEALHRLASGQNDKIALPNYGGEANITKPRK